MASIKILCRNVLAPLMESYGFLRYCSGLTYYLESYYRQVNDVLQILTFLKRGKMNSFAFNIIPLSMGNTQLFVDRYDLTLKRGDWSEWIKINKPWECRNYRTACRQWWGEDELIDTNFEEPIKLIKEYVIPVFESGITSESAYHQLMVFEKTVYPTVWMNSRGCVLLSLQAGDYETAQLHMEAIYAQNGQEKSKLELERIKNRDTEYWDKILEEGTKKTLDYLESIKPKRRSKH